MGRMHFWLISFPIRRNTRLLRRQKVVEPVPGARPTLAVAVALAVGLERRLAEGQVRLPRALGGRESHQGFEAPLALCLPGEGEYQPLRRHDLAIDAANPEIGAGLDRSQAAAPAPARPHVHAELPGRIVP